MMTPFASVNMCVCRQFFPRFSVMPLGAALHGRDTGTGGGVDHIVTSPTPGLYGGSKSVKSVAALRPLEPRRAKGAVNEAALSRIRPAVLARPPMGAERGRQARDEEERRLDEAAMLGEPPAKAP
mmetsp:Transcript_107733/g.310192  ORF Transcript_107733/g.310192 Transcript_107733/m.310192 type:complete len:125 (+) Transcript_107733:394-768(+)